MNPSVSAIIPAWNATETIGRAIDSILAQTWGEAEIVVVDDGSTDGTPQVIARDYPQVKLIVQENAGPCVARNKGAFESSGKLIAFLKNDGVYVTNSDLSNPRLVCKPEEGLWVAGMPSWSPDSKKLAYGTSNGAIYTVNLDGSGMKKISGPGNDSNPAWTK